MQDFPEVGGLFLAGPLVVDEDMADPADRYLRTEYPRVTQLLSVDLNVLLVGC